MSDQDTSHADLMDLSSRIAYEPELYEEPVGGSLPVTVTVNGKHFAVLNSEVDPVTGLDALTLQNVVTREVTVAFQGTSGMTDVLTDGTLVTTATPAQYTAAVAYVERMSGRYGPVGSVCGNSLGGGLAAYVGVRDSSITTVTVNPAPVPAKASGARVGNVTNYISTLDPLHRAVVGGGFADRVVGAVVSYEGTSAHVAFIGTNHVGSDRGDPEVTPYNASMSVPFSLFHPNRVLAEGAFGGRIRVTTDALLLMGQGLGRQRDDLNAVATAELTGTSTELEKYDHQIQIREEQLHQLFRTHALEWYRPVREAIDLMSDQIETLVRGSWRLLTVPPAARPVCGWLLDELADLIDRLSRHAQEVGAASVVAAADAAWETQSEVFTRGTRQLTGGLRKELSQLDRARVLVDHKWQMFQKMTAAVHAAIGRADEAIAADLAAGHAPSAPLSTGAFPPWPPGQVRPIQESAAQARLQVIIDRRQQIAGDMVGALATGLCLALSGALEHLLTQILSATVAMENVCADIRTAVIVATANPLVVVGSHLTGTDDELDEFRRRFVRTSGRIEEGLAGARGMVWQVQDAIGNLPALVPQFAVYLEASLFSDAVLESAYDSLIKVRSLAERSELSFAEVDHQLGDHDAQLIDAMGERAADLRRDLSLVGENITVMVC